VKRIRVLIYECDSAERMNEQLINSIQGTKIFGGKRDMSIQVIDLHWKRVTLSEAYLPGFARRCRDDHQT
jgi:hypothetical protein